MVFALAKAVRYVLINETKFFSNKNEIEIIIFQWKLLCTCYCYDIISRLFNSEHVMLEKTKLLFVRRMFAILLSEFMIDTMLVIKRRLNGILHIEGSLDKYMISLF